MHENQATHPKECQSLGAFLLFPICYDTHPHLKQKNMKTKIIILVICSCEKSQMKIEKIFNEFKLLNPEKTDGLELDFVKEELVLILQIQKNNRAGKKVIVTSLVSEKLLNTKEVNRTLAGTGTEIFILETHESRSYLDYLNIMGVDTTVIEKETEEEQISISEIFNHFMVEITSPPRKKFVREKIDLASYVRQ